MSKEKNIENYKNVPNLIFGQNLTEVESLNELINDLNSTIEDLSDNFVSIGGYLKKIKDHSKFKELGYNSIYEFAQEYYKFSRTTTKNFIAVYEKFGDLENSYPTIKDDYSEYSFSQLVELVSVKEDLTDYSPSQTVKELRVTKFLNNVASDKDKLNEWFENDLYKFLKSKFIEFSFNLSWDCISGYYKDHYLSITTHKDDNLIHFYSYNTKAFKDSTCILSCELVKKEIEAFMKAVDEEIDSVSTSSTSSYIQDDVTEEVEEETSEDLEDIIEEIDNTMSGPTSDQIQVEVLDEKVHVQILKNNDQRWNYIRDASNYELIEEMSNDYVHFLKLKRTPFVRVEFLVNQYEYYRDRNVKPKFTRIDNFKILDNGLFECTYRFDDRVIVDYLRENKI